MNIRKKIFEQCAAFLRFFYLRKKSKFNAFLKISCYFNDPTIEMVCDEDEDVVKEAFFGYLEKNYFITTLEAGVAYINICTKLYYFFFPEDAGKYSYVVYIDGVEDEKIQKYLKERKIKYVS